MPRRPKQVVVSNKEVGERVRLIRQDQGLSQVELARRLELSQSNLSAIERGIRGVTVNQVVRIARALMASTDDILRAEMAPETGQRPTKKLMRRLRRVGELPEGDQRILLQLIDGMLMRRQEQRRKRDKAQQKEDAKDPRLARPA